MKNFPQEMPERTLSLKQERLLFLHYLSLKAVQLNTKNGGEITGVFGLALGYAIGAFAALISTPFVGVAAADKICRAVGDTGGMLTSYPGQWLGYLSSPLRNVTLYCNRTLIHPSERAVLFADALRALNEDEIEKRADILEEIFGEIIKTYGSLGPFMNGSSDQLIYHLIGKTKYSSGDSLEHKTCVFGHAATTLAEKTRRLAYYLTAKETVSSGKDSVTFFKNQGKYLFNKVMVILEAKGQFLLSPTKVSEPASATPSISC